MNIRTKIIEESGSLFLAYGIKGVTMDDVARSLGMSKRTIYEHFDNKRNLLRACLDYDFVLESQREEMISHQCGNIIEEIFMLANPSSPKASQEQKHRFMMELKKFYPDIFNALHAERYQEMSERLRNRLLRGINQGIIMPNIEMDIAIYIVTETMASLITNTEKLTSRNIKLENAFHYAFVSFFRGIATPKGIELIDKTLTIKPQ